MTLLTGRSITGSITDVRLLFLSRPAVRSCLSLKFQPLVGGRGRRHNAGMDDQELNALAHERADRVAPMPTQDAVRAGLVGAAVAGLVVIVFTGFARLNSDGFAGATALTVICGFLGPYGYLKYLANQHFKEWAKHYALLREQHAQRP